MATIWFIVFYLALVVVPTIFLVKKEEGLVTYGDFFLILFLSWIITPVWLMFKLNEWFSGLMDRRLF